MLFVRTSWNNVYENSSLWVDKPGSLTGAGTLIAVGQQFRHLNRFLNFIQQVNVSRISLRMPQQDLGRLFSEDRSSAGGSCSSDIIGHKDINACTNTSTFDGFAERVVVIFVANLLIDDFRSFGGLEDILTGDKSGSGTSQRGQVRVDP